MHAHPRIHTATGVKDTECNELFLSLKIYLYCAQFHFHSTQTGHSFSGSMRVNRIYTLLFLSIITVHETVCLKRLQFLQCTYFPQWQFILTASIFYGSCTQFYLQSTKNQQPLIVNVLQAQLGWATCCWSSLSMSLSKLKNVTLLLSSMSTVKDIFANRICLETFNFLHT